MGIYVRTWTVVKPRHEIRMMVMMMMMMMMIMINQKYTLFVRTVVECRPTQWATPAAMVVMGPSQHQ